MPQVYITVERTTFQVTPQSYTYHMNGYDPLTSAGCRIAFVGSNTTDVLTLQNAFFWGNYVVKFDYDKNKIGFAVGNSTLKLHTIMPGWSIALIVMGGVLLVSGAVFAAIKCRKRT